ncbi:unnamed protein product [Ectocarpus sp. 13 AM-2016]
MHPQNTNETYTLLLLLQVRAAAKGTHRTSDREGFLKPAACSSERISGGSKYNMCAHPRSNGSSKRSIDESFLPPRCYNVESWVHIFRTITNMGGGSQIHGPPAQACMLLAVWLLWLCTCLPSSHWRARTTTSLEATCPRFHHARTAGKNLKGQLKKRPIRSQGDLSQTGGRG